MVGDVKPSNQTKGTHLPLAKYDKWIQEDFLSLSFDFAVVKTATTRKDIVYCKPIIDVNQCCKVNTY